MELKFVSHASIIVVAEDATIWSDPWLDGKVFNESWSLSPASHFDSAYYDLIDYIWISHEHPDHFHIPTLKSLPKSFKEKVTILFQENNSNKLSDALSKLGYQKIIRLPHRSFVKITPKTTIWNYQVGLMDSVLAICSQNETILNLNDAQISIRDAQLIKKQLTKIDVLLNQFSMAGYNGQSDYKNRLPHQANLMLERFYKTHEMLAPKKTIPFASMIYFSSHDNKYMNDYSNTPASVYRYFKSNDRENDIVIMYPGDLYVVDVDYPNDMALKKYSDNEKTKHHVFSDPVTISKNELTESFCRLHHIIKKRYYRTLIKAFLKPLYIQIPDLDATFLFDIASGKFYEVAHTPDLIIYSQPLNFAMKFDWGFQTLGVSARHQVMHNYNNYKRHRILFALNNAEVWLKVHLLFTIKNLKWITKRLNGLFRQLKYRTIRQ